MNTMNVMNKTYSTDLFYKNVNFDISHILSKERFSEAYDPIPDNCDFSSNKKKLKDFEIELGIEHTTMPWYEV